MKVEVKFDLENHLSSRGEVPDLDKVVDYLRKIPGPKVMGVVDWRDGRFNRLINSKPRLSEPLSEEAFYIKEADTVLFRGEEVEIKLGHMLAIGLKRDYNFPKIHDLDRFVQICENRNFIAIVGDCPDYAEIRKEFYLWECNKVWKKFDSVKVWASERDPRPKAWGQYDKALDFF